MKSNTECKIEESLIAEIEIRDIVDMFNKTYYEVYVIIKKKAENEMGNIFLTVRKIAIFKHRIHAEEFINTKVDNERNIIFHIKQVKGIEISEPPTM